MPENPDPAPVALGDARAVLDAQPFNDRVGARIVEFGEGRAVLELDIADHHRQQFGVVHGGVLAYLVDNAATFACGTVLGAGIITGGITATYLAAARDGMLRATATVTAHTARRAVATVTVDEVAPDGAVRSCTLGQGEAVVPVRGSRT